MGIIKSKFREIIKKYNQANVAIKAGLWFTICSVIQKGISVITMPIFTRLMSVEQYGEYNIFLTWYNIFTIFTTLNIQSEVFNKGLIDHSEQKDEFTANQAGLLITLSLAALIIYLPFQKTVNSILGLSTVIVIVMLAEILANALIGLWSARKKFDYEYRKIVKLTLSISVLNPVAGVIAVVLCEDKVGARIVSMAMVAVVVALFLLLSMRKYAGALRNIRWWKPVLIASLPLLPHYLSLVLLNQSDKLMIKHFVDAEAAAVYSVAHTVGLLMTILNNAINSVLVPWLYGKLKKSVYDGIGKIVTMLVAMVLIANMLFIWMAPEVIRIVAAPQYANAIWCFVPISLSVFFTFIYTVFVDVEIYYGKNQYVAIVSILAAVINIVLNYIFIPQYGYVAAGYTTLASYMVTMLLHFIFVKHILKLNGITLTLLSIKSIILMIVILTLFVGLVVLVYAYFWIRLSVLLVAMVGIILCKDKVLSLISEMRKNREN